jgi:hypothetical protein
VAGAFRGVKREQVYRQSRQRKTAMAFVGRQEVFLQSTFLFFQNVKRLFEKRKVLLKRSMALTASKASILKTSMDVARTS